jgi:hypothetical protein
VAVRPLLRHDSVTGLDRRIANTPAAPRLFFPPLPPLEAEQVARQCNATTTSLVYLHPGGLLAEESVRREIHRLARARAQEIRVRVVTLPAGDRTPPRISLRVSIRKRPLPSQSRPVARLPPDGIEGGASSLEPDFDLAVAGLLRPSAVLGTGRSPRTSRRWLCAGTP